jgi:hypothetical protein
VAEGEARCAEETRKANSEKSGEENGCQGGQEGSEAVSLHIQPGVCRFCRCTDDKPCRLLNGDACCWMTKERIACSNPDCVMAEERRVKAAQPRSRFSGWGKGAIVLELRREARRRRKERK